MSQMSILRRFVRAFKTHEWSREQRRHHARQYLASVGYLGKRWRAVP